MSSDQRWTGGLANREWQRGTRAQPVVDVEAITGQVRAYLRDCRTHRQILSPDHHPTLRSCLKVVFGPENAVRDAYAKEVSG